MNEMKSCEICASNNWEVAYIGKVRNGSFGNYLPEPGKVFQCSQCGIQRLREVDCVDDTIYENSEYRTLLNEAINATGFFEEHDVLQMQNLNEACPASIRNKTIADVGCAAGSFIDHVRGLAKDVIAIEPCQVYHETLTKRGCHVYSSVTDAEKKFAGKVDLIFSFSVIEHVNDPKVFLQNMKKLLTPNGKILISTPNRKDLLMELLPDVYSSFFYRTVHRWYFDSDSLEQCANVAGFKVSDLRFVHRFDFSNTVHWLKEKKPKGNEKISFLSSKELNGVWKSNLENTQKADYLYMLLEKI